jgi:hypothetical protein
MRNLLDCIRLHRLVEALRKFQLRDKIPIISATSSCGPKRK